jgi:uncharacterized protein YecE (DUF72 family)
VVRETGLALHVGVSGFSYPAWRGEFYPKGSKPEEFLSLYASRLGSVEVNSSFYAWPKKATLQEWARKTEESFVFSFKAPGQITHVLRLKEGSTEAANGFAALVRDLGPRSGPILFQLPPFMKANNEVLEKFLVGTAGIGKRVFEFREKSWFQEETFRTLEDNEAGFCIAETEDLEPVFKVFGGLAYFRLRKDSYDEKDMVEWGKTIARVSKGAKEVFVYLRHDKTGRNAVLAQNLLGELS